MDLLRALISSQEKVGDEDPSSGKRISFANLIED